MSFTERVMAFCRANPSRWIPATAFEDVGGRQAWRTRIAEARKRFEAAGDGTIENRQRIGFEHQRDCPAIQVWDIDGACNCWQKRRYTISEYRYVPADRSERDRGVGYGANIPMDGRLL